MKWSGVEAVNGGFDSFYVKCLGGAGRGDGTGTSDLIVTM